MSGNVADSSCTGSCSGGGSVVNVSMDSVLGNLGNSHVYSVNGTSLTAYGFNNNGTPTALYGKNESSTEQGLGIASDSDYEIDTSTFVQLDVSQLVAAGYTNAQILFTSVQSGESYNIYGSNTLGKLGTKLSGPGTLGQTLIAMSGYGTWKYIGIQAGERQHRYRCPGVHCAGHYLQHRCHGCPHIGDMPIRYRPSGCPLQLHRPGNGRKRFVHLLYFQRFFAGGAQSELHNRCDHGYADGSRNFRFHR